MGPSLYYVCTHMITMHKLKSAKFVTSVGSIKDYQSKEWELPEICLVGRSNVGKSSLVNMLTNHRGLARVSNSPGRTRLLNFFELAVTDSERPDDEDRLMLVDLPGYGYAAASKATKEAFSQLIGEYLESDNNLKFCFVLLDIRHAPSKLDTEMLAYLYRNMIPFGVIATKADKLSKSQLNNAVTALSAHTGLGRDNIIPVDHKGYGKDNIIHKIAAVLESEDELRDMVEDEFYAGTPL